MLLHHTADGFLRDVCARLLPGEKVSLSGRLPGIQPVPDEAVVHLSCEDGLPFGTAFGSRNMDLHTLGREVFVAELYGFTYAQACRVHEGDDALVLCAAHGVDDLFHLRFCRDSGKIFVIAKERDLVAVPITVQDILVEKDQLGNMGVNGPVAELAEFFQVEDV